MQNSAKEYDKFLKLLDNLITRIDLTMDSTRLTVVKKQFVSQNITKSSSFPLENPLPETI